MNNAQTIFTIFYGVYFAAAIPLTATLRPFDTPAMYYKDRYAWIRFGCSFLILNILPLAYFVIVFGRLSKFGSFSVDFLSMVMLLILSLVGFGFYRLYFGVMLIRYKGRYIFYGDDGLPKPLIEQLELRGGKHQSVAPHLVPGLIWIATTLVIGWLWTQ